MTDNIPNETAQALAAHQAAKSEYLQHQERLQTLADRTERLKKTAEAAQAQAYADGQSWRVKLREQDGELTKEIQKLRQDAVAAEELANEYELMAGEVELEQEMARFDIEPVRKNYRQARTAARKAYASTLQAQALQNLLNTDEGQEFFRVFAVTGLIYETGQIQLTGKPAITADDTAELVVQKLGQRIFEILDECAAKLPCYPLESEAWEELAGVARQEVENFPLDVEQSLVKKMRRKAEIDAIRQQESA